MEKIIEWIKDMYSQMMSSEYKWFIIAGIGLVVVLFLVLCVVIARTLKKTKIKNRLNEEAKETTKNVERDNNKEEKLAVEESKKVIVQPKEFLIAEEVKEKLEEETTAGTLEETVEEEKLAKEAETILDAQEPVTEETEKVEEEKAILDIQEPVTEEVEKLEEEKAVTPKPKKENIVSEKTKITAESKPVTKPKTETAPKAKEGAKAKSGVKAETKSKDEVKATSKAKEDAKSKSGVKAETKSKAEVKATPKAKEDAKSKSGVKVEDKPKTASKAKAEESKVKKFDGEGEVEKSKYTGKWIIKRKSPTDLVLCLLTSNGEVVFTSEIYTNIAGARLGLDTIKKNIALGRFQIHSDKNNHFFFKLKNSSNKLLGNGPLYKTEKQCLSSINSVKRFSQNAEFIKDVYDDMTYIKYVPKEEVVVDNVKEAYRGKWVISRLETEYQAKLYASNGEVLLVTERYASINSVQNAIKTIKTNASVNNFIIDSDKSQRYFYRLRTDAKDTLCIGEAYTSKSSCINSIESVKRFCLTAEISEETGEA